MPLSMLASAYNSGLAIPWMGVATDEPPPLPPVLSWQFGSLVALSLIGPYAFCSATYAYHFYGQRTNMPKLRDHSKDAPKDEHRWDWKTALGRPEGISAVMVYWAGIVLLGPVLEVVDLMPASVKDLSPVVKPFPLLASFLIFDGTMWTIHVCQHYWRWLYFHTHAVHHTIRSPTIICALTGFVPDTLVLIVLPFHVTLVTVPCANFLTIFLFAVTALWHLHMIHSEFEHPWDPLLRKLGLVSTWDHHVHHLQPRKNLAHFFTAYDRMFGTYVDPLSVSHLQKKASLGGS